MLEMMRKMIIHSKLHKLNLQFSSNNNKKRKRYLPLEVKMMKMKRRIKK